MNEWFATVLISVREIAKKSGRFALADEMDVALLVLANEEDLSRHSDVEGQLSRQLYRGNPHGLHLVDCDKLN